MGGGSWMLKVVERCRLIGHGLARSSFGREHDGGFYVCHAEKKLIAFFLLGTASLMTRSQILRIASLGSDSCSASRVFAKSNHLGEYRCMQRLQCFRSKSRVCLWISVAFGTPRGKYKGVAHNVRLVDNFLFTEAEGVSLKIYQTLRDEAGLTG